MPARIILAFAFALAQLDGDALAGGGDCYAPLLPTDKEVGVTSFVIFACAFYAIDYVASIAALLFF